MPRFVRQLAAVVAGSLMLGAIAEAAQPAPTKDDPVDPTKRAPISTANAVRPSPTPRQGNGVVNGRVIRMNEIPVRTAASAQKRAAVDVRETRKKERVIKPTAREKEVRRVEVSRASDRPASIPRIDRERFQRMLRDYEDSRTPAAEMLSGEVDIGGNRADLGEINRFVNPRATLEAQGIPVIPAGSGEASGPAPANVPVSQEKNGGSANRDDAESAR